MVDFSLTPTEQEIIELTNIRRRANTATSRYWDYHENIMPGDPLIEPVPKNPDPDPLQVARLKELENSRARDKKSTPQTVFGTWMRMNASLGGDLPIQPIARPSEPPPGNVGSGLGNATLRAAGTPEQKKKWGIYRLAMANTEPGCGSDSKMIETTAVLDGDEWVLNGEKIFCTGGMRAHGIVVWANIDPDKSRGGIKCFVVMGDNPGLTNVTKEKKLGIRNSDTTAFVLKDCRVPHENLLGLDEEIKTGGGGFKGLMQTFNMTRPGAGAGGLVHVNSALDFLTREYKKDSIEVDWELGPSNRSALQEKLVDMEADLEAGRLTVLRAYWLAHAGIHNNMEASVAKAKGGRVARTGMQMAIELLGAIGITHDTLVEKSFRDSRIADIWEGTGEINRLVIARGILNYSSEDLM